MLVKLLLPRPKKQKSIQRQVEQESDRKIEISQKIASQEAEIEKGKTDLITKEVIHLAKKHSMITFTRLGNLKVTERSKMKDLHS